MFSFLKKSPPPDSEILKAAAHKIVDGLLTAEIQDRSESQSEGYTLPKPLLLHPAFPLPSKLVDQYAERIPPSTLRHWTLSAKVSLTPEEVAIRDHIAKVVNEGYEHFQKRISSAPTQTKPGDFRLEKGEWQFNLPLQTLHEPDIFMDLLRRSGEQLHQDVQHRVIHASLAHIKGGRGQSQPLQRR